MSNTNLTDNYKFRLQKDVEKSLPSKIVDEVFGMLHNPNQKAVSIKKMDEAIGKRIKENK